MDTNTESPRIAYSMTEAASASTLSKRTLYRLQASGTLRTVKLRGRTLVPVDELHRLCGANVRSAQ